MPVPPSRHALRSIPSLVRLEAAHSHPRVSYSFRFDTRSIEYKGLVAKISPRFRLDLLPLRIGSWTFLFLEASSSEKSVFELVNYTQRCVITIVRFFSPIPSCSSCVRHGKAFRGIWSLVRHSCPWACGALALREPDPNRHRHRCETQDTAMNLNDIHCRHCAEGSPMRLGSMRPEHHLWNHSCSA